MYSKDLTVRSISSLTTAIIIPVVNISYSGAVQDSQYGINPSSPISFFLSVCFHNVDST